MTSETTEPKLGLIVAVAENGVIGRGGGLPWEYPEDRAHFEATTHGHVVVMGRRTWEETLAPLAGRTNIVVSRSPEKGAFPESVRVVRTLEEALTLAFRLDPRPFVIGGARLFDEAMPRVGVAFVTRIPGAPVGDTFFRFDTTGFELVRARDGDRGVRFEEWARIS